MSVKCNRSGDSVLRHLLPIACALLAGLTVSAATNDDLRILVDQADVIVVGRQISGGQWVGTGSNACALHEVLLCLNFNASIPWLGHAWSNLKASEVLKWDDPEQKSTSFLRLSELWLSSGEGRIYSMDGVWLLRRAPKSKLLWANRPEAFQDRKLIPLIREYIKQGPLETLASQSPNSTKQRTAGAPSATSSEMPDISTYRSALRTGTPLEKYRIIEVFKEQGLIPLIPDLIDCIPDDTYVPLEGDMSVGSVGECAHSALTTYARVLDGIGSKKRGFWITALPTRERRQEVQEYWRKWWEDYRKPEWTGPSLQQTNSPSTPTGKSSTH